MVNGHSDSMPSLIDICIITIFTVSVVFGLWSVDPAESVSVGLVRTFRATFALCRTTVYGDEEDRTEKSCRYLK